MRFSVSPNARLRKAPVKMYRESVPERGDEKNEEVKLYNKYAYDYLDTREGEEREEKQEREARRKGKSLREILEY
jgi:hypothetical protein